jgi:RimJ/RimL family protein N-acetyltransferase
MLLVEGRRVVLRDLSLGDSRLIHDWTNDPEINRFLLEGFPRTHKDIERFINSQMTNADPINRALAVARRDNLTSIGFVGCFNIDWHARAAELGVILGSKEHLGKGYGTEAVTLLLKFAFDELGLHRLFLRVFDFNERAIQSYRKCGFVEEGRLREAYYRDGAYFDIIMMSILEEEYQARTQELENSRTQESRNNTSGI